MLTDPKLRSQVDALWDKFWMGIRPDMSSRKSCVQSRVSTHGSRLTRAAVRHVRSEARIEGLRGRMSEAGRQVEGLFESLLPKAFH